MSIDDTIRNVLIESAEKHARLSARLQDPEVVVDHVLASDLMRLIGQLAKSAELYRQLEQAEADLAEARELLDAGEDEETLALAESEIEEKDARRGEILRRSIDHLVSRDELSDRNVILEIRAGTGGGEAALFAADLFRMYLRFAERMRYRSEVLSLLDTELGGVREVVLQISGPEAHQNLRFESGGHRVQRVPETETQGRIHTSLATVAVMPEADEIEVNIRREDLRIDFYRASGPGGQKVNKTSSAVRMIHLPTGLKVECQDEKSQHKNKARALKILSSRLFDHLESQKQEERSSIRRNQIGSGDRNERIRTYNFPQNRVTDHRLNESIHDVAGVMDGDLVPLISLLREREKQIRLEALRTADV